jgi:hypothetical protein
LRSAVSAEIFNAAGKSLNGNHLASGARNRPVELVWLCNNKRYSLHRAAWCAADGIIVENIEFAIMDANVVNSRLDPATMERLEKIRFIRETAVGG